MPLHHHIGAGRYACSLGGISQDWVEALQLVSRDTAAGYHVEGVRTSASADSAILPCLNDCRST